MSASTRTVHSGLGTGPLIAGLTMAALAVAVAGALVVGQATISIAPAEVVAPQAPSSFDRGWSSDAANRTFTTLEAASLQERIAQNGDWRSKTTREMAIRLRAGRAAVIDTTPRPGEFRLAPGNLQPTGAGVVDTTPRPGEFRLAPGNLQPTGAADDSSVGSASSGSHDLLRAQ